MAVTNRISATSGRIRNTPSNSSSRAPLRPLLEDPADLAGAAGEVEAQRQRVQVLQRVRRRGGGGCAARSGRRATSAARSAPWPATAPPHRPEGLPPGPRSAALAGASASIARANSSGTSALISAVLASRATVAAIRSRKRGSASPQKTTHSRRMAARSAPEPVVLRSSARSSRDMLSGLPAGASLARKS